MKTAAIFMTLLALSLSDDCSKRCPHGFQRYKDSCYFFSNVKTTWEKAKIHCYEIGAHLAIIEKKDEDYYLLSIAQARTGNFWVDGTDAEAESHWLWASSQTAIRYFNWDKPNGEPNGKTGQNCLALYKRNKSTYYKWHDIACTTILHYICETEQKV